MLKYLDSVFELNKQIAIISTLNDTNLKEKRKFQSSTVDSIINEIF